MDWKAYFTRNMHRVRLHSVATSMPVSLATHAHAHAHVHWGPLVEVAHKAAMLFFSLTLVLGAYALFSPQFRTFAYMDITERAQQTAAAGSALEKFWGDAGASIASEWRDGGVVQNAAAAATSFFKR